MDFNMFMVILHVILIPAISIFAEGTNDTFLVYTDLRHGTVYTMSLDGKMSDICLPKTTFGQPHGITHDPEANVVYLTDDVSNAVYSLRLDGKSESQLVLEIGSNAWLYGIAYDGEGHLFVTDVFNRAFYRLNVDGTGFTTWLTEITALDIVVDTKGRYLIWGEYNGNAIERASIDDPLSREVLIANTLTPFGISMDITARRIYWCEHYNGRIFSMNIDGNDLRFVSRMVPGDLLRHIRGFGGHLYLTTSRTTNEGDVYMVYDILENGTQTEIFSSLTAWPFAVIVLHGNVPANVCHVTCKNGGALNVTSRTCICINEWTGPECDGEYTTGQYITNGIEEATSGFSSLSMTYTSNGDTQTTETGTYTSDEIGTSQKVIQPSENSNAFLKPTETSNPHLGSSDTSTLFPEPSKTSGPFIEPPETSNPLLEPTETRNPFLEPSVIWPTIGAVMIVLILSVTIIVIFVLRHKQANSKSADEPPAPATTNDLIDFDNKAANTSNDPVYQDIDHDYQYMENLSDTPEMCNRTVDYESIRISKDPEDLVVPVPKYISMTKEESAYLEPVGISHLDPDYADNKDSYVDPDPAEEVDSYVSPDAAEETGHVSTVVYQDQPVLNAYESLDPAERVDSVEDQENEPGLIPYARLKSTDGNEQDNSEEDQGLESLPDSYTNLEPAEKEQTVNNVMSEDQNPVPYSYASLDVAEIQANVNSMVFQGQEPMPNSYASLYTAERDQHDGTVENPGQEPEPNSYENSSSQRETTLEYLGYQVQ